jgi:hypothetical protein
MKKALDQGSRQNGLVVQTTVEHLEIIKERIGGLMWREKLELQTDGRM